MTTPARSRHDLLCALVLTALTLGFFGQLFAGRTFSTIAGHQNSVYPWRAFPTNFADSTQNDQADLSYPWQCFATQSLREGEFPFWNPYSFGGQPFFANGSSSVAYPPRLLLTLLFSPSWTHDLLSILHVLGAGLAMHHLLRGFGWGARGSLFAAVTWMFSAFNISWLQLEVVAPVFLFLPLNLLVVRIALRRESPGACLLAAAVLASCLVAGHLPFMGITCLVAIAYAGVASTICAARRAKVSGWRGAVRPLAVVAGVAILPGLLAAVVLLPTMLAVGGSQRAMPGYEAQHEQVRAAASVFFKQLKLFPTPASVDAMHSLTFMGFAAVPFMLLGAVGGVLQRRAGVWLALSLSTIVFLVAVDTPLLRLAYAVIPGFGTFRPLSRLLYLHNFALAMLAGLGLDLFLRWLEGRGGEKQRTVVERWKLVLFIAIAASTFHLIRYGRKLNARFHPRTDELLYPVTPLLDAAKRELAAGPSAPGRVLPLLVYPPTMPWPPPILYGAESMIFGIESITGYDSVIPRRSLALCRIAAGESPDYVLANPDSGSVCPSYKLRETRFDLLPRFGITHLLAPPEISGDPIWKERSPQLPIETAYDGPDGMIFRITGATPGPYVVHNAEMVQSEADALRRFADSAFDHRSSVLLENDPTLPKSESTTAAPAQPAQILKVTKGRNHWAARVKTEQPGWLVIPDTWSPGWRAHVNGTPAPVRRANYAFRAVAVPAGESEVRLDYHPEGFAAGAAISSGTVLVFALGMFLVRRRPRATLAAPQN